MLFKHAWHVTEMKTMMEKSGLRSKMVLASAINQLVGMFLVQKAYQLHYLVMVISNLGTYTYNKKRNRNLWYLTTILVVMQKDCGQKKEPLWSRCRYTFMQKPRKA